MQAYIVRHWNYISILDVNIWCFWLLMFAKIYLRWQDEWICFCVLYLFLPSCLFYADHKPGDILGKSARKWTQGWDSHVFVGQKKKQNKKEKKDTVGWSSCPLSSKLLVSSKLPCKAKHHRWITTTSSLLWTNNVSLEIKHTSKDKMLWDRFVIILLLLIFSL